MGSTIDKGYGIISICNAEPENYATGDYVCIFVGGSDDDHRDCDQCRHCRARTGDPSGQISYDEFAATDPYFDWIYIRVRGGCHPPR